MFESSTIPHPLIRHAQAMPQHPAAIDGNRILTYGELDARSIRVARNLYQRGIRKGDRIVLAARISIEWIVFVHACGRVGAVIVPVAPELPKRISERVLEHIQPSLICADSDLEEINESRQSGFHTLAGGLIAIDEFTRIDPNQVHSIILTSGTSGEPKAICLSYANHIMSALASGINLGIHRDDRWLLNLPAYHIGGFAIIMRAAMYGTTVVVQRQFDASEAIDAIEQNRVTQLSLVSVTLKRLLKTNGDTPFPSWIRSVLVGGGPVDADLLQEGLRLGLPVLPTYGMTETTSQIATSPPGFHLIGHSLALPSLPFCEISIRDASGSMLEHDKTGTIHVRGPMVAVGLWIAPHRIEPIVDSDGWLRTYDSGCMDEQGRLSILGRVDRVINSGGEIVHPEEIEEVMHGFDVIRNVAVIGVPDREWGERTVAVVEVESKEDFNSSALRQSLSKYLPPHKRPHDIVVVDTIPKTATGKVDYSRLRQVAADLISDQTAVK